MVLGITTLTPSASIIASATIAMTFPPKCIEKVIRVSLRAKRSSGFLSKDTVPTKNIFTLGHCFKMGGVHAGRRFTQMVKRQSGGYWANKQFIGNSMCQFYNRAFRCILHHEHSIAHIVFVGYPKPASLCFLYFGPKACLNTLGLSRHNKPSRFWLAHPRRLSKPVVDGLLIG